MREILFRGKRFDNGEWVEGESILINNKYTLIAKVGRLSVEDGILNGIYNSVMYAVDPSTVGQYTGLKDKNGERIFEGDIIHLDYIGKTRGVEGIATVIFENGKFGVKWGWHKEFVCLDGFANTTLEIVGNIHDNTQLSERGVENAPDVR